MSEKIEDNKKAWADRWLALSEEMLFFIQRTDTGYWEQMPFFRYLMNIRAAADAGDPGRRNDLTRKQRLSQALHIAMPAGIVFSGPSGSGRHEAAACIAKALLSSADADE